MTLRILLFSIKNNVIGIVNPPCMLVIINYHTYISPKHDMTLTNLTMLSKCHDAKSGCRSWIQVGKMKYTIMQFPTFVGSIIPKANEKFRSPL